MVFDKPTTTRYTTFTSRHYRTTVGQRSTATCLSRFTSTSLLLAATVLCAVSRVVDVHSVVVHQLL